MKFKGAYIKALLMIVVFSMNTIIGSACSLSKVFHQSHHHNSASTTSHDHENGTTHSHEHSGSHHDKEKSSADECCSKFSVEFNNLDKSVNPGIGIQVLEFSSFVLTTSYYNAALLSRNVNHPFLSHIRWRFPATIPDLRIVIQSFQI